MPVVLIEDFPEFEIEAMEQEYDTTEIAGLTDAEIEEIEALYLSGDFQTID